MLKGGSCRQLCRLQGRKPAVSARSMQCGLVFTQVCQQVRSCWPRALSRSGQRHEMVLPEGLRFCLMHHEDGSVFLPKVKLSLPAENWISSRVHHVLLCFQSLISFTSSKEKRPFTTEGWEH